MTPTDTKKIQTAILQTIAFYDLFSFPLTNVEIYENLWRMKCQYPDFISSLQALKHAGKIGYHQGFYYLAHKRRLVSIRKERHISSIKKMFQLQRDKWIFSLSPFISFVGIANTLAYSNAKPSGDIDLLVVTRKDRIFTARLFLTFWLYIFGKWRHGQKITNRYCLSFFLSGANLNLQNLSFQFADDVYLVYWTKWLLPYYCPNQKTVDLYFIRNQWLRRYLPNTDFVKTNSHQDQISFLARFLNLLLDGGLGDLLENILKKIMMAKIDAKTHQFDIDGIMASSQILKFHPTGKRKDYLDKWQSLCKKII